MTHIALGDIQYIHLLTGCFFLFYLFYFLFDIAMSYFCRFCFPLLILIFSVRCGGMLESVGSFINIIIIIILFFVCFVVVIDFNDRGLFYYFSFSTAPRLQMKSFIRFFFMSLMLKLFCREMFRKRLIHQTTSSIDEENEIYVVGWRKTPHY